MKTIELYYIGDGFYWDSGTSMSSIYVVDTHKRFDWGFVHVELSKGNRVHIRPATDAEMVRAYKELDEIRKRNQARKDGDSGAQPVKAPK